MTVLTTKIIVTTAHTAFSVFHSRCSVAAFNGGDSAYSGYPGRAIAQAVSRWLPTQVEIRVQSCGICGGQSGAGVGFLRVLRFPLPIFIPPISPQSPSLIIRGWYNSPVVAAVPKVPPHKLQKKYSGYTNCSRSQLGQLSTKSLTNQLTSLH
jgi:hypothetical protein